MRSENIVWDEIVPRLYPRKVISLRNKRVDYPLRDVYNRLKGRNVTFTLNVEVTPIVGYIYRVNFIFLIDYDPTESYFF